MHVILHVQAKFGTKPFTHSSKITRCAQEDWQTVVSLLTTASSLWAWSGLKRVYLLDRLAGDPLWVNAWLWEGALTHALAAHFSAAARQSAGALYTAIPATQRVSVVHTTVCAQAISRLFEGASHWGSVCLTILLAKPLDSARRVQSSLASQLVAVLQLATRYCHWRSRRVFNAPENGRLDNAMQWTMCHTSCMAAQGQN